MLIWRENGTVSKEETGGGVQKLDGWEGVLPLDEEGGLLLADEEHYFFIWFKGAKKNEMA